MKLIILLITFLCVPIENFAQSFLEQSGEIAFSFYHSVMSPVKSPASHCQFSPSCSHFSSQAISKYGFIKGMLMTSDRLMRCSGGNLKKGMYPRQGKLLYDPPECNYVFADGGLWQSGVNNSSKLKKISIDGQKDSAFSFARHLFDQMNYDLSILELKRVEFYSSDNNIKDKAKLLVALNCLLKKDIDCSRDNLESISSGKAELTFDKLILNFVVNDVDRTYLNNETFLKNFRDSSNDYKLLANKFLIYTFLKLDETDSARSLFADLKKDNFLNDIDLELNYFDEFESMAGKSPALAGIMSAMIPGSGYMYCGEVKEGISAFIVNGLLGWGIYSLFANDNTGSGILTSLVAVPFYFGNIVGSVNAAHLYNNLEKEVIFQKFRKSAGIDIYFSLDYFKSIWD